MKKLLIFGIIVLAAPLIIASAVYAMAMCDRSTIELWSETDGAE